MFLKGIVLQNFRSYSQKHFAFNKQATIIVGPNTAGKSNLMEAIYLLATGKSFRAQRDTQMIAFEKDIARVKGHVLQESQREKVELEVVIATGELVGNKSYSKKYLVNGIPRRRTDFISNLAAVLFSPQDLEIIVDSPSIRRGFLDSVLEAAHKEYRLAKSIYEKAIRQRNALLEQAKEAGRRNQKLFEYWDTVVIENGSLITHFREQFIAFVNTHVKTVFNISLTYDKSVISKDRLLQYKDAELAAGATLVGPHRDDMVVFMHDKKEKHDISQYGSRGQQRLAVVQLKLLQMDYIQHQLNQRPMLLLDDIFPELDDMHIHHPLDVVTAQQTIITTTHKEFIQGVKPESFAIYEL